MSQIAQDEDILGRPLTYWENLGYWWYDMVKKSPTAATAEAAGAWIGATPVGNAAANAVEQAVGNVEYIHTTAGGVVADFYTFRYVIAGIIAIVALAWAWRSFK